MSAPEEATVVSAAQKRQKTQEILSRFQQGQDEQKSRWLQLQGRVPCRLYHYTTLDGLRGITGSQRLWASDAHYMNDASELKYAMELIDEEVQAVLDDPTHREILEPFIRREGMASPFGNAFGSGLVRPFIACFCEVDDLLSQWRGYGQADASVSLGMDFHITVLYNLPPNSSLRKVVYEEAQQRALAREATNAWLSTLRSMVDEGCLGRQPADLALAWRGLQDAMVDYHLCFKHHTFHEEQEWRLIKLVYPSAELSLMADQTRDKLLAARRERTREAEAAARELMREAGVDMPEMPEFSTETPSWGAEGIDIRFRQSTYGLTPYVEIPIHDPTGTFMDRIPIRSVRQGPRTHPELALESLAMYLQSVGYSWVHTPVEPTAVPLRI